MLTNDKYETILEMIILSTINDIPLVNNLIKTNISGTQDHINNNYHHFTVAACISSLACR